MQAVVLTQPPIIDVIVDKNTFYFADNYKTKFDRSELRQAVKAHSQIQCPGHSLEIVFRHRKSKKITAISVYRNGMHLRGAKI